MTISVKADMMDETGYTEEVGRVIACTRTFKCYGVTGATPGEVCKNALAEAGVPVSGDVLSADTSYAGVRVTRRIPSIESRSPDGSFVVAITIEYTLWPVFIGNIEESDPISYRQFSMSGGASLNQETAAFEQGDPTTKIEITYNSGPTTITQSKRITVADPRVFCSREAVLAALDPDAVCGFWIGKVNSAPWKTVATIQPDRTYVYTPCHPREWLCTSATNNPMNVTLAVPLWKFQFEFEYRPKLLVGAEYKGGWDPVITYDDEDGYPVRGTTWGNGIREIQWPKEADFNLLFPY